MCGMEVRCRPELLVARGGKYNRITLRDSDILWDKPLLGQINAMRGTICASRIMQISNAYRTEYCDARDSY